MQTRKNRDTSIQDIAILAHEVEKEDRKKRTGPRSKLVEAIAVLLFSKPLRSAEIAQILGYSPRYISSYLSYWKVRGLFEYENGFWMLTPSGEEFARSIIQRETENRLHHYTSLALSLMEKSASSGSRTTRSIKPARKGKNVLHSTGLSSRLQSFIEPQTFQEDNKTQETALFILCIESMIDEEELTPDEHDVLNTMINHFIKWGSTYLYLDQLEEIMKADQHWLLRVLRLLQAKGLIYIYNDRRLGTRIGFSKKMRNLILTCMKNSSSGTVEAE